MGNFRSILRAMLRRPDERERDQDCAAEHTAGEGIASPLATPTPCGEGRLRARIDRYRRECGDPHVAREEDQYYYRMEIANGWHRYFTSVYEITRRHLNDGDLRFSPDYAAHVEAGGEDRAFYFFPTLIDALVHAQNRHSMLNSDYESGHDYELAILARYCRRAPALDGREAHHDESSNTARYLMPPAGMHTIADEYIQVWFAGAWLPKRPETGELIREALRELSWAEFLPMILTPRPTEG